MKRDIVVFFAAALAATVATALPGRLIKPGANGSFVLAARADSAGAGDTTWRDTTLRDTTWRDTTLRDTTSRDTTRRDSIPDPGPRPRPRR